MKKNNLHVKKGDEVIVLSGNDKGKKGTIKLSLPREGKVVVEGVNVRKKFIKPTQNKKGSIVEAEFPINASNVKKA